MSDSPDGQDRTEESPVGGDQAAGADEPGWRGAGEEFDFLRDSFRSSFKEGAAEGPSREEVAAALRTLAGAVSHMVAGAGNTLKDPSVKQQVKKTTRSAFSAMAGVLSGLAEELRSRLEDRREERQDSGTPDGSAGEAEEETGDGPPAGQDPQEP